MTALAFEYTVRSDLVVVGTDPEEGTDIIREAHYILAEEVESGRCWRHGFQMTTEVNEATPGRLVALQARVTAQAPDPRGSVYWHETYPRYGSPAFLREGNTDERDAEDER